MASVHIQYIFFSILVICSVVGALRFNLMDVPSKLLALMIFTTLVTELVAFCLAKEKHNNLSVYRVYSLLEYCILCAYYNSIIDLFKRRNLGIYLALGGILFWTTDLFFIERVSEFNTNFLLFEGFTTIAMSLLAMARWLNDENFLYAWKNAHFWFAAILIFFWTTTYLHWALFNYLGKNFPDISLNLFYVVMLVNMFTYLSFAAVILIFYKKRISK